MGGSHVLLAREDAVYGCGWDGRGQLACVAAAAADSPDDAYVEGLTALRLPALRQVVQVAAGEQHRCAACPAAVKLSPGLVH